MPKHCIAAHSWEQFEIGAYRSMLGAAEKLGMSDLQQCASALSAKSRRWRTSFSSNCLLLRGSISGNTPHPELIEDDRQRSIRCAQSTQQRFVSFMTAALSYKAAVFLVIPSLIDACRSVLASAANLGHGQTSDRAPAKHREHRQS
jgi:hypothetical protein